MKAILIKVKIHWQTKETTIPIIKVTEVWSNCPKIVVATPEILVVSVVNLVNKAPGEFSFKSKYAI